LVPLPKEGDKEENPNLLGTTNATFAFPTRLFFFYKGSISLNYSLKDSIFCGFPL
jgi:hypothetical protein